MASITTIIDCALPGMLHIRPDKSGLRDVPAVGYDDSAGCGKSWTEWGIMGRREQERRR